MARGSKGEDSMAGADHRRARLALLSGEGALSCLLGLAAVRVWIQCILFDSYVQADDGMFTIINNFAYGAAILAGALAALHRPPSARMQARLGWVAFALMAAAPLGLLAVPGQLALGQMIAVGTVAGIAGGLGAGVWTAVYARLGVQQIVLYGMSSLALGSVGGFAVSFLPADPAQVVSILMAAVAQLCYRRALQVVGPSERPAGEGEFKEPWLRPDPAPVYDGEPKSTTWLILGGLAVFGFALGISRGYPAGEPVTMGPALRALHQFGVAGLALLVMHWTLVRGKRLSFSLLWRIEIGVAALGALTLSIMPDEFDALAIALENVADSFMLGVLWVTMADASRHCSWHAYTVFGLAWAVRVFSREVGRVLILVLGSVSAAPQTGVVIGAVTAAIGASMALLLSENVPHTRPFFDMGEEADGTGAYGTRVTDGAGAAQVCNRTGGFGDTPGRSAGGDARTVQTSRAVPAAPAAVRPASVTSRARGSRVERPGGPYGASTPTAPSAFPARSAASHDTSGRAIAHPARQPEAVSARGCGAERSTVSRDLSTAALLGADDIALSPAELARMQCLRADFGLSEREAQVATLIAQGRSKAAIARHLYVSENTVRTHAKNAYAKLGVCSKSELEGLLEGLA